MKKIQIRLLAVLFSGALFAMGCTGKFEKINTNPSGVTQDVFKADYGEVIQPLKNVQKALIHSTDWEYQLQENLNSDIYSGFMMTPTPFNSNINNANYYMEDGWNVTILDIAYNNVMQGIVDYHTFSQDYSGVDLSDCDGMAKVLDVIEMHRCADIFGPIIYSKYGQANADLSVDFDTQQEAYNAFFKDLDTALTDLKPFADGTKTVGTAFKAADLVYSGNAASWVKLINTLRLRLALHIVYADPATAKLQGEKALDPANGGLITDNADDAFVHYGAAHPIYDIISAWGDIRSGAPLGSYLNGYKDPRVTHYMTAAIDPNVSGQYIGIRNGVKIDAKSRYGNYSSPAADGAAGNYFDSKAGLAKLSTASEAYFLMAEAALRGWSNAGDIQTDYETGIAKSFEEWGAGSASNYINDATDKPAPYKDPNAMTAGENDVLAGSPNLSTITIKWDAGASFEKKLERIATQKWIALYPDGQEAWTEFRRTKYPILFPVVVNNSNGVIKGFINRLPIPTAYQTNNKSAYQRAVAAMGGPDNGNTKVWWDKK